MSIVEPRTRTSREAGKQGSAAPVPGCQRTIRVAILGYGRIGQAVAALAERERARLRRAGVEIRCVAGLVRDARRPRAAPAIPLIDRPGDIDVAAADVVVETLGGVEPARSLVSRALAAGVPVVTANKTLVARHGHELAAIAACAGTSLWFDAAVVAGVPFLGALARRPLLASARAICGVINGTSHAVLEALAAGASFDVAIADAVTKGYAEPDSSADTSGRDAAEKLTILLHLAGCTDVDVDSLPRTSIDVLTPEDLNAARQLGGRLVPVAWAELEPGSSGAWVGPAYADSAHPLAALRGADNAVEIVTGAGFAVRFSGPGAGPAPTAATILDDVFDAACAGRQASRPHVQRAPVELRTPPPAHWCVIAHGGQDREDTATLESAGVTVLRSTSPASVRAHLTTLTDWRTARRAADRLGREVHLLPALGLHTRD